MRINKYLARMGVASRRKADEMIMDGEVLVNGKKAVAGMMVGDDDWIKVGSQKAQKFTEGTEKFLYIMVNKPVGVVTTVRDEQNRKTVMDLVKTPNPKSQIPNKFKNQNSKIQNTRLFPVGRLDVESEGLVLLTNDGEWAYKLTHPKFEVTKEYEVEVEGKITNNAITQLRKGVRVQGKLTAPAVVERLGDNKLKFVIREGRNRQVRRMCKAVNLEVLKLKRVAIGEIRLGDLNTGEWRRYTKLNVGGWG